MILNFQIEECGLLCDCDYVQLFDGLDNDAPTLSVPICGKTTPNTTFVASSNTMFVEFKSDGDTQDKGFSAHFFAT